MKIKRLGWAWLVLGTLGCGGGGGNTEEPAYDFSIVALPDTQMYSQSLPDIYQAQTAWIVENAATYNIVFVTHLGDITNRGDQEPQWVNADAAMALLDQAGIPYGTCLGNHDLNRGAGGGGKLTTAGCTPEGWQDTCVGRTYLTHYGPARFAGQAWYGGTSPTGLSNFQLVEAAGVQLLFLHLAIDPNAGEIAWAQQILTEHPDAAAHVSTHRYLIDYRIIDTMPDPLPQLVGGRGNDLSAIVDSPLFDTSVTAEALFDSFIAKNRNIYMVECGHVDGEFHQTSQNQAGLAVHELLSDFQEMSETGGDGWLKILHFSLKDKQVRVRTYSPTLGRYRENGEGFDRSVEMVQSVLANYHDQLALFTDIEAVDAMAEYLTNTTEGRKEYYDALYGAGQRDSDFTLDLDLTTYSATR